MLAIARELNNADTAFVLPADGPDHDLRIRFFTPQDRSGVCRPCNHRSAVRAVAARRRRAPAPAETKGRYVEVEVRGHGLDRSIAIRQPAPALGRELNERERLAVLDALALSSADLDPRCPMRIAGGSAARG